MGRWPYDRSPTSGQRRVAARGTATLLAGIVAIVLQAGLSGGEEPGAKPVQATGDMAEHIDPVFVTISGNGIDRIEIQVVNTGNEPANYRLVAGTFFKGGGNEVMTVEDTDIDLEPGQTVRERVGVMPLSINNKRGVYTFRESDDGHPELVTLTRAAGEAGGGSNEEILRTAAIILNDDPPLSTIASFPTARHATALPPAENLQVDAGVILESLILLRGAGLEPLGTQIGDDLQLKLETMVDPDTHDAARGFYWLTERDSEWNFWRDILENGDRRYKHYALYGIGRYFPDVAIDMMPRWIRNRKLPPAYRLAAIHALAYTLKPEATEELERLQRKYPAKTNMGKATREAMAYIEERLTPQNGSRSGEVGD